MCVCVYVCVVDAGQFWLKKIGPNYILLIKQPPEFFLLAYPKKKKRYILPTKLIYA